MYGDIHTMSRPKPTILLESVNKQTFKAEQVLNADAIYSVFFKYKKVSFSNPGHAFNLAQRLNKIFQSDDFTVVRLTQGDVVTEDEIKQFKEEVPKPTR